MVLALGVILITFPAMLSAVNHVIECFRQYTLETSAIMGAYRLTLGLAVPIFVTPWQKAVGVGWVVWHGRFLLHWVLSCSRCC